MTIANTCFIQLATRSAQILSVRVRRWEAVDRWLQLKQNLIRNRLPKF